MHILVTNDDGPPSSKSSPYVHSLIRELQKAGHTVSVCLPHTQRSWVGKAHMIGQTVKPLYYRPTPTFDPRRESEASTAQGTTHTRPSRQPDVEEWILVDGTPASCAQIGLYHLFTQDKGPIDLVVSGPNYGRNTTAVFALSSGTLGGALEAAVCNKKSIALSFAFFTRNHDPEIIDAATKHSVRIIEKLYAQWPGNSSVDLYSVNVPLIESIETQPVLFTDILQNYWTSGAPCFEEVEGSVGDEEEEEERIREDEETTEKIHSNGNADVDGKEEKSDGGGVEVSRSAHRHFRWKPRFIDVWSSVKGSNPGNDGWAVDQGYTSVTPLKANFWQAATEMRGKELELDDALSKAMNKSSLSSTAGSTLALPYRPKPKHHFHALIAYEDDYVQPLVLSALEKVFPTGSYTLVHVNPPNPIGGANDHDDDQVISLAALLNSQDITSVHVATSSPRGLLQITPYEAIDWSFVAAHPDLVTVNSYMLRKALIRKHYLSATIEHWVAKRPDSVLKSHYKRSESFELDYAEFLDDALVEAFDLRASLERNERILVGGSEEDSGERDGEGRTGGDIEWWILKPSMSDRGQGIRLFCTMQELQGFFDEWEAELPDSESESESEGEGEGEDEDDDQHAQERDAATSKNGEVKPEVDADMRRASKSEQQDGIATSSSHSDRDFITASHLRHFVAQPYIHPPLLLSEADNRKFHIRTYVVCVGSLDVYVYRPMLALFAGNPYTAPSHPPLFGGGGGGDDATVDLEAHLTNTCLQRSVRDGSVRRFWEDLPSLPRSSSSSSPSSSSSSSTAPSGNGDGADDEMKKNIFDQICAVTGEVFEAAARGMMMHFRPLENAFEIFGLDFLVDDQGKVWLLEVNAFPDFKQTGSELKELVEGLWRGALGIVGRERFGMVATEEGDDAARRRAMEEMAHVRRVEMGR